tara:strand:+ start:668 stop:1099 length:432 start_codon:yes stop_codon:yes gene_type:complete
MTKISDKTKALNAEHNRVANAKAKGITLDLDKATHRISNLRSGSLNPTDTLTINSELYKRVGSKLPNQVLIICELVEQNGGKVVLGDVNDYWIASYIDTGKYKQDLMEVLAHYIKHYAKLAELGKDYKKISGKELDTLFVTTS